MSFKTQEAMPAIDST